MSPWLSKIASLTAAATSSLLWPMTISCSWAEGLKIRPKSRGNQRRSICALNDRVLRTRATAAKHVTEAFHAITNVTNFMRLDKKETLMYKHKQP
jgi:hypothetical protein